MAKKAHIMSHFSKFAVLHEGYNHHNVYSRFFHVVFLLRRILLVLTVLFLQEYPAFQMALFFFGTIAVMVFSIEGSPYED